ncbi:hypothetical protein BLA18110_02835 [Burkholderia lata]|nr:hypothetical protein BLA18110_02835 [Burkholderia lata]
MRGIEPVAIVAFRLCDGRVGRVAAVEPVYTIVSEPGYAFVEAQSRVTGQANAAPGDGNASLSRRGDALKQPHPLESAYRGESGSV